MQNETLLISSKDVKEILNEDYRSIIGIIENCLRQNSMGGMSLPQKISMVFDEKTQNRINCMPAWLHDDNVYGVKWVSVFPNNPSVGLRNVGGTVLLSELETGRTICVMDAGYLTDIRTAAVGAVAAKYLAKKNAETIGFIGAGNQARRHLDVICSILPNLKRCYVSSRTDTTPGRFIEEEAILHPNLAFEDCGNKYRTAIEDADIIVTATSGQDPILKHDWIKTGALYIHVGGYEDEYAVASNADRIICDDWDGIKHRTQTISRMYKDGLLSDKDIYGNLEEIVLGGKKGRENSNEFIYFCSVGIAYFDVAIAKYVYEKCQEKGLDTSFDFS